MSEVKIADAGDLYCDLDAEEQVLHYLAFENNSIIADVDEKIFYGTDNKLIFEALKKAHSNIPKKLFRDTVWRAVGTNSFEEIESTVESVLKGVNPKTYPIYQSILKDLENLYLQREIITGASAAKESAESGFLDDAVITLKSVLQVDVKRKIDTGDYVADFEQRIEKIKENSRKKGNEVNLIPTGLIKYDQISGGIQKGEVGVIIAEIGGGKSVALTNFAIHAWLLGFNVHLFGLEMQRFENQFRMDSYLTDIPANLFRFSSLQERDYKHWANQIKGYRKNRKNFLEVSFARGISASELLSFVESNEIKHGKKVDLVLVDYLTLIGAEKNIRDFHMQQRETFIIFSDWAMTNQKAIWTASQSTDEGVKRKDGMRTIDVKYSRAIAEFAQIICALYQGKEDEASGTLTFVPIKGRGFKKGTKLTVKPDFAHMVLDTRSQMLNQGTSIKKAKKKRLGR